MSFNQNICPACKGAKRLMAFVCGKNIGGVQVLDCLTCKATGFLSDPEMAAYNEQDTKKAQRRAVRLALNLSMREMAKKMGVPFLDYNDYEHGRIDLELPTDGAFQ